MDTAAHLSAAPYRFIDGDMIKLRDGGTWRRGVRVAGQWSERSGEQAERSDEVMRAALASDSAPRFMPLVPTIGKSLPGVECLSRDALLTMELRPATGATLYTASLNTLQSFCGNEAGVLRNNCTNLTRPEIRASLQGTLARHPGGKITYQRIAGRLYARYAIQRTLHTHVYVLTAS